MTTKHLISLLTVVTTAAACKTEPAPAKPSVL